MLIFEREELDLVVTGSRVYGPYKSGKDIDIVLPEVERDKLEEWLQSKNIPTYQTETQKTYAKGGYYFKLGFIEINIISAFVGQDLNQWQEATNEMKRLEPIEDHKERVNQFQDFFY